MWKRIAVDMGIAIPYLILLFMVVDRPIGLFWGCMLGIIIVACINLVRWGLSDE